MVRLHDKELSTVLAEATMPLATDLTYQDHHDDAHGHLARRTTPAPCKCVDIITS